MTSSPPHSYAASYPPNLPIDPAIKSFFESFYAASDSPANIESYAVNFFTPDATVVISTRQATGTPALIELRKSMWVRFKSRRHTVHKVFPFGEIATEVMTLGTVEYELKNGKTLSQPFAGNARLSRADGGEVKMSFYQVFMDSAPAAAAMQE